MALPKRKTSKARKGKRRINHSAKALNTTKCKNCGEQKLPHRLCVECGK